ncbi:MAG: translocation/assembly module TamB, partial [Bacteroidota bacterium]|nr:translocation/assembly module TamB [Bacteroidota bacterium]
GLVKKEFELVKGGTVVWNGDVAAARMDVKARYISNTAPYPLVANSAAGMSDAERNRLQARLPFEVLIGAKGELNDPAIEFGLDLPRMMRNSYPQVDTRLEELSRSSNEEELNRQVFSLLVLNSFIIDDPGSTPGGSGLAQSAARNSVNQILSDQLNKLTGKYVQGVDISLGVNTYDQTQGGESYQRTSVDYKVSKSVFDERLTFEVGGSVGVDEDQTDVSNVNSTRKAQYAIMYDLTEDGRIRLRGFHENAFDLYDGEITRSGIAVMYTKEFEENAKARQQRREQLLKGDPKGAILPKEDEENKEEQ